MWNITLYYQFYNEFYVPKFNHSSTKPPLKNDTNFLEYFFNNTNDQKT